MILVRRVTEAFSLTSLNISPLSLSLLFHLPTLPCLPSPLLLDRYLMSAVIIPYSPRSQLTTKVLWYDMILIIPSISQFCFKQNPVPIYMSPYSPSQTRKFSSCLAKSSGLGASERLSYSRDMTFI